jgi:hypothetical protein
MPKSPIKDLAFFLDAIFFAVIIVHPFLVIIVARLGNYDWANPW